jgi:hypothetical protein
MNRSIFSHGKYECTRIPEFTYIVYLIIVSSPQTMTAWTAEVRPHLTEPAQDIKNPFGWTLERPCALSGILSLPWSIPHFIIASSSFIFAGKVKRLSE